MEEETSKLNGAIKLTSFEKYALLSSVFLRSKNTTFLFIMILNVIRLTESIPYSYFNSDTFLIAFLH